MASFGDSRGQRQLNESIPVSAQAYYAAQKDGRSSLRPLSFPATRTALWDPRPTGPSQTLHIANTRCPVLILEEKTIRLAHRFAEQNADDSYTCTLSGSLNVHPDGEGVSITVDEFDTCRPPSPSEALPDNVLVPCKVQKKSAKPSSSVEDYSECIKSLYQRCGSRQRVDLSQFVSIRAYCGYHGNHQSFIFHMTFDLLTPATVFRLTPVNTVPIAPTALSKNLSGPMSVTEVQGQAKSGYLTMDETRKLLLILESDPKVNNLPLIGIWVSGVTNVHDPFVWASCLRYLHNSSLKDRVCIPPEQFLVVLFSPLQSRPLFFQANTANGRTNLDFSLSTCHEVIQLPKDSAGGGIHGRTGSPMELEMSKVESGDKQTVLQAAMESCRSLLSSPLPVSPVRPNISVDDQDITPRSVPTPHVAKAASIIQPSVPDVSLLMDDPPPPPSPYNGANIPTSHPLTSQQHYPPPQPQPAPSVAKVKKKKKDGSLKNQPHSQPQMYVHPQPHPIYMQSPHMMPPMQQYPQVPPGFPYSANIPNNPYMNQAYPPPFQPPTSQMQAFPPPQHFHPQYEQQPPPPHPPRYQQPQAPPKKKQLKKSSSKSSLNQQEGVSKQQVTPAPLVRQPAPSPAPQYIHQAPSTPVSQVKQHVVTPAPTPISQQAMSPHVSTPMLVQRTQHQLISPVTSLPGSPQVPGAHDSADSGLHDSSGEPQEEAGAVPTTLANVQSTEIPPHYLETMRQQQEQIANLMKQVSLLQQLQQQQATTATTMTTTKQQQDSSTQSSDPNSPVKKQVAKNSVAINTTMWYPPPPIRESPPERQRDVSLRENSSMSFNDYPQINTSQQDMTTSIVSDIIVDLPEYTSMSPDRCNLTNDPQSPVFESASMCANQNASEQYTQEYVNSQQQYHDEEYHEEQDDDHTSDSDHSDGSEDTNPLTMNYDNIMVAVQKMLQRDDQGLNGSHCTPHDSVCSHQSAPSHSQSPYSSLQGPPQVDRGESRQHIDGTESTRQQIDVVERTRQQIALYTGGAMGSDSSKSSAETTRYEQSYFIDPAMVQRIEYQSMMLEKEFSIDTTDTLAMKYLSDDVLSQLAKARLASPHKAGGVDTLMSASSTPPTPNKHFSIASREYMLRYGLLDDTDSPPKSSENPHYAEGYRSDGQFNSSSRASTNDHHNVRRSLDASLSQQQKSDRVLDIEELKELPKLF